MAKDRIDDLLGQSLGERSPTPVRERQETKRQRPKSGVFSVQRLPVMQDAPGVERRCECSHYARCLDHFTKTYRYALEAYCPALCASYEEPSRETRCAEVSGGGSAIAWPTTE